MKKIEAIVRMEKLDDVKNALDSAGYPGVTVSEVEGHGKQKGVVHQWRGQEYKVDLLPKVKIEIVVSNADDVNRLTDAIVKSARTGGVGDGKIFVTDVSEAIRIRTGDRGDKAIV